MIRRTSIDRMAMVEAATDGIAFDKLNTHYGLSSLSLKFGIILRMGLFRLRDGSKLGRLNGRIMG